MKILGTLLENNSISESIIIICLQRFNIFDELIDNLYEDFIKYNYENNKDLTKSVSNIIITDRETKIRYVYNTMNSYENLLNKEVRKLISRYKNYKCEEEALFYKNTKKEVIKFTDIFYKSIIFNNITNKNDKIRLRDKITRNINEQIINLIKNN